MNGEHEHKHEHENTKAATHGLPEARAQSRRGNATWMAPFKHGGVSDYESAACLLVRLDNLIRRVRADTTRPAPIVALELLGLTALDIVINDL